MKKRRDRTVVPSITSSSDGGAAPAVVISVAMKLSEGVGGGEELKLKCC